MHVFGLNYGEKTRKALTMCLFLYNPFFSKSIQFANRAFGIQLFSFFPVNFWLTPGHSLKGNNHFCQHLNQLRT